jgi:nitrate/TMAO reductase-like tetraheme cytochrome c subunit
MTRIHPVLIVVAIAIAIAAAGAAVAAVEDRCADCHKTPPPSAKNEEAFLERVHTKHLDEGLECGDCHDDPAPSRAALDALLEGGND